MPCSTRHTTGASIGSQNRNSSASAAHADLRADLDRIGVPTLVMHRRGDRAVRFEAGEHLARHIPRAAWHPLEGVDHFWWCGDTAPVIRAILEFAAR
jgi:pimeloyl-ACP methyl ester carboxylesterase